MKWLGVPEWAPLIISHLTLDLVLCFSSFCGICRCKLYYKTPWLCFAVVAWLLVVAVAVAAAHTRPAYTAAFSPPRGEASGIPTARHPNELKKTK